MNSIIIYPDNRTNPTLMHKMSAALISPVPRWYQKPTPWWVDGFEEVGLKPIVESDEEIDEVYIEDDGDVSFAGDVDTPVDTGLLPKGAYHIPLSMSPRDPNTVTQGNDKGESNDEVDSFVIVDLKDTTFNDSCGGDFVILDLEDADEAKEAVFNEGIQVEQSEYDEDDDIVACKDIIDQFPLPIATKLIEQDEYDEEDDILACTDLIDQFPLPVGVSIFTLREVSYEKTVKNVVVVETDPEKDEDGPWFGESTFSLDVIVGVMEVDEQDEWDERVTVCVTGIEVDAARVD
ncbi:hypothetical protein AX15_003330 [Amanita polypyramis BW_CC]|nr:hypothetical protein AX15_003330 [Amanita polypyramis BW_CC]